MIRTTSFLLASSVLLAACGQSNLSSDQSEAVAAQQTAPERASPLRGPEPEPDLEYEISKLGPDEALLLDWDDLMPPGEDAVIAQLFQAYFAEQERLNKQQSEMLSDFGDPNATPFGGIAEGSLADQAIQIGTYNTVDILDGVKVRIPGFVVPLRFGGERGYDEFILVPYFGACLHSPPPPPNQTLFIKADPPAKVSSIFDPVWVEGTLKTGEFSTSEANSAYEMTLTKIEAYEY